MRNTGFWVICLLNGWMDAWEGNKCVWKGPVYEAYLRDDIYFLIFTPVSSLGFMLGNSKS